MRPRCSVTSRPRVLLVLALAAAAGSAQPADSELNTTATASWLAKRAAPIHDVCAWLASEVSGNLPVKADSQTLEDGQLQLVCGRERETAQPAPHKKCAARKACY